MDISESAVIAMSKKVTDLASAGGETFSLDWDSWDEDGVPEKYWDKDDDTGEEQQDNIFGITKFIVVMWSLPWGHMTTKPNGYVAI